ncbi:MAG: tRNA lysidine(34) synthetase [Christensenellales bacterium]
MATAHHADDNVETVLMHLFRGSGIGGLIGMTEYSDRIVRPLIHATRAQIEAFVRENDVSFVTDETNLDDGYTRNFLRLKVIRLSTKNTNLPPQRKQSRNAPRRTNRLSARVWIGRL